MRPYYGPDKNYHPGFGAGVPPLINPVYRNCYIIGSLSNGYVQEHAATLRVALPEWQVFDDWQAAHPNADDEWRDYETYRGYTMQQALRRPAAQNVFQFDKTHLDKATHGILVLPAGKSGHLELGYLVGRGCATAILLDADYDRWDVMYAFADIVTKNLNDIIEEWS